jgi:hypothetical protein
MPEVQEVFRMATQKVRPDPGALERQQRGQRRRTIRRKVGVYGLVAALVAGIAVVAVQIGRTGAGEPIGEPSSVSTAPDGAAPVGTVTFDGSTCSVQLTADPIESGVVVLDIVNATSERVMFDMWRILDVYSFEEFETAIDRLRRRQEAGKEGSFPEGESGPGQQVVYLSSDIMRANGSGRIVSSMSEGPHAIVCLKQYEGLGLRPAGIAGPIGVV